jgi:hypothetical protein
MNMQVALVELYELCTGYPRMKPDGKFISGKQRSNEKLVKDKALKNRCKIKPGSITFIAI